jgi:GNAT superfamily N-acetyltransferase
MVHLQWGVPDELRLQVAKLIYDTFVDKFRYTIGPRYKGISFIAASLQSEFGLVAFHEGKFVGVACAKTDKGELFQVRFSTWIRTYHIRALQSFFIGFPFWYERNEPEVLTLASLSIKKGFRGKGIGTKIVKEFIRYGSAEGFQAVKLAVINSNVRAKELYERLGFKKRKYTSIPRPWSFFLGFTGVYELIYYLD